VLKYLNGMKYLQLIISINDLGILKWYVVGTHNGHWDCSGEEPCLPLKKEAVTSYLRKKVEYKKFN
jgi:hypothetical protein